MNHENYPFSSTTTFRKFRLVVPLGFLFFALVAASACESIENEDAAADATLRGSSSGAQTRSALSCVSMDRRVTADTTVTLRCEEGEE